MANYNDISRLSRIRDHNIYQKTDHLYNPLRNAIRKSAILPLKGLNITTNNIHTSRVSKDIRTLNANEVQNIKRNTLIPFNRQLTPTYNLQKIMGKTFKALDVEQKVFQPISPEEFERQMSTKTRAVVYEVAPDELDSQYNIYTYKNIAHSPETSRKQARIIQSPTTIRFNGKVHPNDMFRSRITPDKIFSPQPSLMISRSKQDLGVRQLRKGSPQPLLMSSRSQQDLGVKQFRKGNHLGSKGEFSTSALNSNVQLQNSERPRVYDFKQSTASTEILSPKSKRNEEYKFNLFSIIDEAGNNGCKTGCCGSNQIVASKPVKKNAWL